MLGFIKRWSREFNDPYIFKTLFTSIVRPNLEYASQVWSPTYRDHVSRLEAVQRNFLRYALRNLQWANPIVLPPYKDRLLLIDMKTLESRRIVADILFILQVFNKQIDCAYMNNFVQAQFRLNDRFRSSNVFYLNFHRTNYGKHEPVNRMLSAVNNNLCYNELSLTKNQIRNTLYLKLK